MHLVAISPSWPKKLGGLKLAPTCELGLVPRIEKARRGFETPFAVAECGHSEEFQRFMGKV